MRVFLQKIGLLVVIAGGVATTVALYRTAGRIVLTAFRTKFLFICGNYYRRSEHPLMFWIAIVAWLAILAVMTLFALFLIYGFYVEFVRSLI
jgi:hypothetical protein